MPQNNDSPLQPSDIYSTIDEIREELARRRLDPNLPLALKEFWGDHFPSFLVDLSSSHGFFSRPIITPNIETKYFLDVVRIFNIEPLLLEFPDKFVSRSKEKLFAGKLRSFDRHRPQIKRTKTLIDFQAAEGKPIMGVDTVHGTPLLTYHQDLFAKVYPQYQDRKHDITDWFRTMRTSYPNYYTGFLALFILNGVLFENFLLNDPGEKDFFEKKVLPSLRDVTKHFGYKPLIFPILPLKDERDTRWLEYHTQDIEDDHDSVGI
jgi:hypothetical protein